MAMTAFEILGILKLDKDSFERGLKSAQSEAQSAGSIISRGADTLMSGITTAAKVGIEAVGAATTAAAGFGKSAVSAATEYESAFTGVRKTTDLAEEDYKALSDWIMDASTKMASSQEEIAGTMEIAGQLGIDGVSGLEAFTKTMIMLGDTTNLNAEEAAGALARFMNITGDSAQSADKIGSVIVDLGNHFATTEADIVSMATRLAGSGSQFGLSAADILGVATALSSVGIQAEMGGSAFSKAMIKMQVAAETGYEPVNELLQFTAAEHGIDNLHDLEIAMDQDGKFTKQLALELNTTSDKIKDTVNAGKDLLGFADVAGMKTQDFIKLYRDDSKAALMSFIVGLGDTENAGKSTIAMLQEMGFTEVRLRDTLTRLSGSGDLLTQSINMANVAYEENNALMNEAELRYATHESRAQQMANAYKNLKIAIGDELLPMYSDLMAFSSQAMESMQKGFEEGGVEGLIASFGESLSAGLEALNDKLPRMVKLGVQLVEALGKGIMDNLGSITEAASQIVSTLLTAAAENLPSAMSAASQILSNLLDILIENLPAITPLISEFIVGLAQMFADNAGDFATVAVAILGAIGTGLKEAAPIIMEKVPDIISALKQAFEDNPDAIGVIGLLIVDKLAGALTSGISGEILARAGAGLLEKFVVAMGPVILSKIAGLGVKFTLGISNLGGAITSGLSSLGTTLASGLSSIGSFATADLGAALAAGGTSAIAAGAAAVASAVVAFFGGAEIGKKIHTYIWPDDAEMMEGYEGIKGTLLLFRDFFVALWDFIVMDVEQTADQIKECWNAITNATTQMWENIKSNVSDSWNAVKQWFSDSLETINKNVSDVWEAIKNTFSDSWENLKQLVSDSWEVIKDLFSQALEFIYQMTVGVWVDLIKLFVDSWDDIKALVKDSWEYVKNTFSEAWDNIKQNVLDSWANIKNTFSEAWEYLSDMVESSWENIKKYFSDAWENITSGISDMWDNIKQSASDFWDNLKSGIEDAIDYILELPEKAWDWGADMIENFVDGIKGKWDDLKGTLGDVGEAIEEYIGFSEPEVGPLSHFHEFAPDMMDLFATGIRDNIGLVENALEETAGAVQSGFEISATPTYDVNVSGASTASAAPSIDERLDNILQMLEAYLPYYATAEDMDRMTISVNSREFGRLVREVG